jgi:hypothetical protein
MRLSSGERRVQGYSNPQPKQKNPVRAESGSTGVRDGMGRGWVEKNDLPPLTERRAREFNWATQHLPDEHPGLVVSTLISLELGGQKQTTKTVMARLEAQGRTAKQMGEKGWL